MILEKLVGVLLFLLAISCGSEPIERTGLWDSPEIDKASDIPTKIVTVYQPITSTSKYKKEFLSVMAPADYGRVAKEMVLDQKDYPDEADDDFCMRIHFKLDPRERISCHMFNQDGLLVRSYRGIKDNDRLYIVPEGKVFVWPATSEDVGRKIPLIGLAEQEGASNITLELLSDRPRLFRLHNFLCEEEIEFFLNFSRNEPMKRSTGGLHVYVEDGEEKVRKGVEIRARTSTNTWDTDSDVAHLIMRRSFDVLRMRPFRKTHIDGLQIVRYEQGQFYDAHTDYYDPGSTMKWNWDSANEGINRMATIFLYLTDGDENHGGSTMFPKGRDSTKEEKGRYNMDTINTLREKLVEEGHFEKDGLEYNAIEECTQKLHVRPKRGDAILFYSQDPNGRVDKSSTHAACPVLGGEKIGANLWIWNGPMVADTFLSTPKTYRFSDELRDQNETFARNALFRNDSPHTVYLFWDPEDGEREPSFLEALEPGMEHNAQTFVHHRFSFYTHEHDDPERRHILSYRIPDRPIDAPPIAVKPIHVESLYTRNLPKNSKIEL